MDPLFLIGATVAFLILSLATGAWIYLALLVTSVLCMALLAGFPVARIGAITESIFVKSVISWELASVPLFLWMGEIISRSDLSTRLFRALAPWVSWLPGGLLHTNVAGCVLFGAVSGSSVATAATIGKVTTKALSDRHYDTRLSVGSIAAAGGIGIMIPPSLTLIIYGLIAEVSVARLFAAGLLPGLLLAALFSAYIAVRCTINPSLAPAERESIPFRQRLVGLRDLAPVALLILLVLGGIYSGVATPSEAAAIGVAGALLVTATRQQLTLADVFGSALNAARTMAMLGTAFAAAAVLSTTMGLLHIPHMVAAWIGGMDLHPIVLIVVLTAFFVLLGCVLESIAMILMAIPIVLPLVKAAGYDPVWFGVYIVLVVEMGLLTPPIGFNLFVIRGVTGQSIATVARGALPFFLLMLLAAAIITAFPEIALWLPRVLFG